MTVLCLYTHRRETSVAVVLLVLLVAFFLVLVSTVSSASIDRPNGFLHQTEIELHTGWTACHASAVIDPAYGCTLENRRSSNVSVPFVLMNISTLPTTAMAVLLDNQQIDIAKDNNITMENIYYSQNLGMIPDIHITGRDFYTLLYQIEIPHWNTSPNTYRYSCNATHEHFDSTTNNGQKVFLKFAGINYRATVWYNGIQLPNLQYRYFDTISSLFEPNIPGMFVRHRYDITPTQSQSNCVTNVNNKNRNTNLLVVMIEPPFHPGYPAPGQQGGSHDLAQDGAIPQYMLGWDWCTSMPDRATGFYGAVTLDTQTYAPSLPRSIPEMLLNSDTLETYATYTLHDPAIQTLDIDKCSWTHHNRHSRYVCSDIKLRILAHIEWSNIQQQSMWQMSDASINMTLFIEADWGEFWSIPLDDESEKDGFIDIQSNITVQDADIVHLWWPHGVGVSNHAHMHNFTIYVYVNNVVSDVTSISVGIRTIDTYLDQNIQGQRYRVNHHDIYLVGGNWIGPDQALRYSASKKRYCDEIFLHQYAGFNLIRVWGGSTAERDQFYECADQHGMLVYQEFWMTGDNNGRWAGNYSWPLDYNAYLVNVEDTIKRLRHHPSLLFYCGCNECLSNRASPWAPNPPRSLDDGMRQLLDKFDPGRFYISSSMGGVCISVVRIPYMWCASWLLNTYVVYFQKPNKGDTFYEPSMYQNRTFSLAYSDGPYGMLLSPNFFNHNPGQPFRNVSIGFQPEIGSVSIPSSNGLSKFLSREEIVYGYPHRNTSSMVGDAWTFHNFLPWTTALLNNESYDHVYAYFGPNHMVSADDWNDAAQLASHMQYQNLCNGYISRIFKFTSAVIIWKTQSPWPSMRGFLYDWYLESTGMMTGAHSALWSPISAVLDLQSWQLILVNRQVLPMSCTRRKTCVQYTWIDIHGRTMSSFGMHLLSDTVPAMSSALLGLSHRRLKWPNLCTSICFLRLEGLGTCDYSIPTSWYWLTDPELGENGNYSLLGDMRSRQMVSYDWEVIKCAIFDTKVSLKVILEIHAESADVLLYPAFSIFRLKDGTQLLPLVDLNHNEIVLLPGTSQSRYLQSTAHIDKGEAISVKLKSWNGSEDERSLFC